MLSVGSAENALILGNLAGREETSVSVEDDEDAFDEGRVRRVGAERALQVARGCGRRSGLGGVDIDRDRVRVTRAERNGEGERRVLYILYMNGRQCHGLSISKHSRFGSRKSGDGRFGCFLAFCDLRWVGLQDTSCLRNGSREIAGVDQVTDVSNEDPVVCFDGNDVLDPTTQRRPQVLGVEHGCCIANHIGMKALSVAYIPVRKAQSRSGIENRS